MDFALRRRFAFLELAPDYEMLSSFQRKKGFQAEGLVRVLREVNSRIGEKNFHLGVSFFMVDRLGDRIESIWKLEIEPNLEEYFFGQMDAVEYFRWSRVAGSILS